MLSVGGYATVFEGITDPSTKRRAAADLANQIDRWVKDNEAHLTNGNAPPPLILCRSPDGVVPRFDSCRRVQEA